jgi:uncharacterized membrane protein
MESLDAERYVHRIEAFSDVVIGFSLAQLGATLVVPPHAAEIAQDPGWLFGFAWTFALVCLMWWSHNRLFRTVFVPTPFALILNFALLATIVLLVYFAELFGRMQTMNDAIVAGRAYFGTLAVNYLITATLGYAGIRATHVWEELARELRAWRLVIIYAVSGGLILAVVLLSFVGQTSSLMLTVMGVSVPIGFIASVALARRLFPLRA